MNKTNNDFFDKKTTTHHTAKEVEKIRIGDGLPSSRTRRQKAENLLESAPYTIQNDSALGSAYIKERMEISEKDLDIIFGESEEDDY
jgi:aspartyl aminopeptidase